MTFSASALELFILMTALRAERKIAESRMKSKDNTDVETVMVQASTVFSILTREIASVACSMRTAGVN